MPQILLDTCAFLWFIKGSPELSQPARQAIEDPANSRVMSIASAWEMAIEYVDPKRMAIPYGLTYSFDVLIIDQIDANDINWMPVDIPHIRLIANSYDPVRDHKMKHNDPFDRLIIATAKYMQIPLVSSDHKFEAHGIKVIW